MVKNRLIRRVRRTARRLLSPAAKRVTQRLSATPVGQVVKRVSLLLPVEALRMAQQRVTVARAWARPKPVRLTLSHPAQREHAPDQKSSASPRRKAAPVLVLDEERDGFKVKRGQKHHHQR